MPTSRETRAETESAKTPSQLIDERIRDLGDRRGVTLATVRTVITQAIPGVVEEWKWRGVPVWEQDGILCTGETYKEYVKLTFAKGASLPDPSGLGYPRRELTSSRRERSRPRRTAAQPVVRADRRTVCVPTRVRYLLC